DARREGEPRLRGTDGGGNAALPRMRRDGEAAARHPRACAPPDAPLPGCRSLRRVEQACGADAHRSTRTSPDIRMRQIPNPKSQDPNPNVHNAFGISWGLGFGVWVLGFAR